MSGRSRPNLTREWCTTFRPARYADVIRMAPWATMYGNIVAMDRDVLYLSDGTAVLSTSPDGTPVVVAWPAGIDEYPL